MCSFPSSALGGGFRAARRVPRLMTFLIVAKTGRVGFDLSQTETGSHFSYRRGRRRPDEHISHKQDRAGRRSLKRLVIRELLPELSEKAHILAPAHQPFYAPDKTSWTRTTQINHNGRLSTVLYDKEIPTTMDIDRSLTLSTAAWPAVETRAGSHRTETRTETRMVDTTICDKVCGVHGPRRNN